jgi:hypothetical protein
MDALGSEHPKHTTLLSTCRVAVLWRGDAEPVEVVPVLTGLALVRKGLAELTVDQDIDQVLQLSVPRACGPAAN